jgi:hypothetical protein
MQLNPMSIAEGRANVRPILLPTDLLAIDSSGPTRNAERSRRRMLLVPIIVIAAARGAVQPSALRAIELYQGLVRAFQRWGKDYELRCGQPYARTMAAVADRPYFYGAGEIRTLADICLTP